MSDLLLKIHGADATGLISEEEDGRWRAFLMVRSLGEEKEQTRGPEFFSSEINARAWIVRQAGHHGFLEGGFDIQVEGQ